MKNTAIWLLALIVAPCGLTFAQSPTNDAAKPASSVPAATTTRGQNTQNRGVVKHQSRQRENGAPPQLQRQPLQQSRGRQGLSWQQQNRGPHQNGDPATGVMPRTQGRDRHAHAQAPAINFAQATQRQHRERHNPQWWKSHFTTIVFVTGCGYYYWDAGYWFPAFGYYPQYENFDYNGPIYTYGDLLPDQVIYNVQRALKELGYYAGPLTGSFSATTRAAVTAFQEDNGLDVTGAIDAPTVEALGLD